VDFIEGEHKACDMGVYFARPRTAYFNNLKYTEFFAAWDYNPKLPARFHVGGTRHHLESEYLQIRIPGVTKVMWLYKRMKPEDSVVRMSYVYITAGEIWYFRLILLNFPCLSFEDAMCFEGITYITMQESAIARGLFADESEAKVCFQEALVMSTPYELRSLLITLALQGFPTLTIFNDPELRMALMLDIYMNTNQNLELSTIKLINAIHEKFRDEDKDALLYGYPPAQYISTELEKEIVRYNPLHQAAALAELHRKVPNNEDQETVYVEICSRLDRIAIAKANQQGDEPLNDANIVAGRLVFIQGQGGSGKSTFAKKILAYARSKKLIAKGCSSTGLSCQVYEDFTTAHSLFGIPVVEDDDDYDHDAVLESNVKPDRRALLENTSLIVWDEFLSNHKQCLECAFNVTNKFNNMVVVCMGDYRQIAPVVINGSIFDVVKASMVSSHLWQRFKVYCFRRNMRLVGLLRTGQQENLSVEEEETAAAALHQQQQYAQMLLELGEGNVFSKRLEPLLEEPESGSTLVRLPLIKAITVKTEALQFVYPNGFESHTMHKSSILAATNEDGDEWNSIVQDMNPNEPRSYFSADVFDQVDDPNGFVQEMMTTEALNKFTKNGCPPHKLVLKVNDICIILRNLNKKDGLSNNTRVRITHMSQFQIRVQTLDENPKSHVLCRIKFKFRIPFGHSFTMTRTQFPLRLGYCMTFNKAQGQEWDKVLADIRKAPFSHGHLYVVLSRIRQSSNIKMFCHETQIFEDCPMAVNVVFNKLKIDV
jgi:hypothetical protein